MGAVPPEKKPRTARQEEEANTARTQLDRDRDVARTHGAKPIRLNEVHMVSCKYLVYFKKSAGIKIVKLDLLF
jgi:hypothetical protein